MKSKPPRTRPPKFVFALAAAALVCVSLAEWDGGDGRAQEKVEGPSYHAVYGRVVYEGTNRPVRRARLLLMNFDVRGAGGERSGLTDSRGEFRIPRVPEGRYFALVDVAGVMSPVSFVPIEELRADTINAEEIRKHFDEIVVDGKGDKEVVVRARRGAAIGGRVTYSDGEPAVGVNVHVMRRSDGRLVKFLAGINLGILARLRTDDRGVFRVAGLPPGEYVVAVSEAAEHGDREHGSSDEFSGRGFVNVLLGQQFLMTFYPAATTAEGATAIRVEAGDEREGVDITIADRELRTLVGRVRGRLDKRPATNASVTIVRRDGVSGAGGLPVGDESTRHATETDEEGRWEFKDIPEGDYTIFVNPSEEPDQAAAVTTTTTNANRANMNVSVSAGNENSTTTISSPRRRKKYAPLRQEVTVSGDDASEILIELGEGGRVSGTISFEGGKALPEYVYITALRIPTGGAPTPGDGPKLGHVTGGNFLIEGLPPGKFILRPNIYGRETDGLYVKSVTWKDKDLLREPLEISEGTVAEDVSIVYASDSATLRVRAVYADDKRPARGVFVFLSRPDAADWAASYAQQLECITGDDGACAITAAPGEYAVIIVRRAKQNATPDEEARRRAGAGAPRVSLRPGAQQTFEAVVPRP